MSIYVAVSLVSKYFPSATLEAGDERGTKPAPCPPGAPVTGPEAGDKQMNTEKVVVSLSRKQGQN